MTSDSEYMLVDFCRDFPHDEACLQWLWRQRYSQDGEHAFCERCEQERVFHRYTAKQQRQDWTCTACGLHVHPTAGTIFHKSSTSLHLWFYAMYLMTSTRSGISAKQLERELGVTYKTAWRIFNLIRTELMTQDDDEPLAGEVEMDETYVGGKVHAGERTRYANLPEWERRRADQDLRSRKRTAVFGMMSASAEGPGPTSSRAVGGPPLSATPLNRSSPTRPSTPTTPTFTCRCFPKAGMHTCP